MQTQQQEERLQLIDRVFHLDPETYIFGGVMANDNLVWQHVEADYTRVDWMKWNTTNIHNAILKKVAEQVLVQNPRYVNAFATVFSDQQFARKSGLACNEYAIFKELAARDLPCNAENVSQIIIDLWGQLADNNTFTENKAETDKRNAQISEMTQGGTTGFTVQVANQKVAYTKTGQKFDPLQGQAQGLSLGLSGSWSRGAGSKSFAEMSNEEVQALFDAWTATQNFRNMSKEDLQKFVRGAGPTDLFGKNVRVPSVAAPDTQDHLYHPVSGEPFNQKSLIKFINQAAYNGRDLITKNGRIVPRLRDLFERTIRGELG